MSARLDRYVPSGSLLHGLAPEVKVATTLAFVVAVVATPRQVPLAFIGHAVVVGTIAGAARLPWRPLLRGLRIEIPFLTFAAFLPFLGGDPSVEVAGIALSEPGLWAAFGIVVKGTLGVAASIVLAATTSPPEVVRGLERLHVPKVLVSIMAFMVRYLSVLADEADRMRIARQSRGYEPRWLWQAGAMATSVGTLFVRSYERGERVYLAMCSRGYDGTMPDLAGRRATRRDWLLAGGAVAPAAVIAAAALAVAG